MSNVMTDPHGPPSVARTRMASGHDQAGAAKEKLRVSTGQCSLGVALVASSETGIAAILIGDDRDSLELDLRDRFPIALFLNGDEAHDLILARVISHIESPRRVLDLPLDIRGTEFQQKVWHALQAIPPGQTTTYADVAIRIGAPSAVRAVAGACAANALAVVIPCHRVVRHDGTLSGYRWGVDRKRELLAREART
jgi:AraC family transcriptional regulator of adaptative response/methylated-DNA-[protein]-cysteine methyltransferase